MDEMTDGRLTDAQIAGVLASMTGPLITPEALAGFATVLRRKKRPFASDRKVLDTCGTGGDGLSHIQYLLPCRRGRRLLRRARREARQPGRKLSRGQRRTSSGSWASPWMRRPARVGEMLLREIGFCFLFAPVYHGAMRHAARARIELGIKSAMNLVGPLSNPADASYQLIGVFDEQFCGPVAEAAHLLGVRRVMAVHGEERPGRDLRLRRAPR